MGLAPQESSARRVPLLLKQLDRWFPPDPSAFLSAGEQTRHESVKASETTFRLPYFW
jgi:hypothetical protein